MQYFAKIFKDNENKYEVVFPDLEPYAATFGNTLEEAIKNAHDSLVGYLLTAEDYGDEVNPPTQDSNNIKLKDNELLIPIKVNLTLERTKE